jgi:DNA processing protein
MDDRRYRVGFTLVKGIGAVSLQPLLDHFGNAETAWNASPFDLVAAGISPKITERIVQVWKSVDLDKYVEQALANGIRILTWDDADYPAQLRVIDQPPPVLYVRGDVNSEDNWSVAIVGTRAVTSYGRQITEELATVLAQNGVTVVSGLARGVDACRSQRGAQSRGPYACCAGFGRGQDLPARAPCHG